MQSAIDHAEIYHDQVRSFYKHESLQGVSRNTLSYESIQDDFSFKNRHKSKTVIIFEQLTLIEQGKADEIASKLISDFYKKHHLFSETIRLLIYLRVKLFYAKKVNKGDLNAAPIVFELHKLMADNDYFYNKGQLSPLGFINIVSLASFLNEHNWLSDFIQKYGPQLSLKVRKNATSLAMAHFHYARREYNQSLEMINQTYFKNVNLKSMAGRLQLINYIDSGIEDTYFLKQKIENYRLLIYRNQRQLSKRVVNSSFNLIKILQLIVGNKDAKEIRVKMSKMDSIFYRYYLSKKLKKIAQE